MKPVVGVLGVQGDVEEHLRALAAAGAEPRSVKSVAELAPVEGLVIPGGESTTVIRLLERVRAGMPLWGTCMGLIVAAHDVADLNQETLDLIDVTVRRDGNTAAIDVVDTGPGIDEGDADRLFDRFFRGDPARNRAVEGKFRHRRIEREFEPARRALRRAKPIRRAR